MNKNLVCNKEEIKCKNIIKQYKNYMTREDIKKHNPNWAEIPDYPYGILIVGGSGSGKANALLNLKNHEPDVDKKNLNAKDTFETKYQLLTNKRKNTGLQHLNH